MTRFMRTTALSVVDLQEPLFKDDITRLQVEQELERHKLSFIFALSPQGRGGVALIVPEPWTFVRGWSLSPRVMHITLRDDQGFDQSFLVAHLHHDPTLRKKQWQDLATLPRALFMANAIWLCDHNSVTLAGRDVANPKITPEATNVLEARDAEISFLMTQGVVDSYLCMHSGRAVDFDLHGWTSDFPAAQTAPAGQRGTLVTNSKRKEADSPVHPQVVHSPVTGAAELTGFIFPSPWNAAFHSATPLSWDTQMTRC